MFSTYYDAAGMITSFENKEMFFIELVVTHHDTFISQDLCRGFPLHEKINASGCMCGVTSARGDKV